MQRDCALRIAGRGRLTQFSGEDKTANCFISRDPGTDSTFTRHPRVFSNPMKAPGGRTFRIVVPIKCAALDAHPSTPPFGMEETGLQWNRTRSSLATNPDSISAAMIIGIVCGDPVVRVASSPSTASFLPGHLHIFSLNFPPRTSARIPR
ncbi:hypothetical protein TNCV_3135721 [Trichonephila clavipes]|nr:hypothetical protein TNCV_3135721 [Trichonephila clavipes]